MEFLVSQGKDPDEVDFDKTEEQEGDTGGEIQAAGEEQPTEQAAEQAVEQAAEQEEQPAGEVNDPSEAKENDAEKVTSPNICRNKLHGIYSVVLLLSSFQSDFRRMSQLNQLKLSKMAKRVNKQLLSKQLMLRSKQLLRLRTSQARTNQLTSQKKKVLAVNFFSLFFSRHNEEEVLRAEGPSQVHNQRLT